MPKSPAELMRLAIALSLENVAAGKGGPFAAIVAKDGEPIASGTNLVTSSHDPTAHAEVVAIRAACQKLQSFQLKGCEIYTTCEPCPMCLGAIYWARPDRIVYANSRADAAAIGFDDSFIYDEIPLPPAQRKIPAIQLGREEAIAAFEAWQNKRDRVEY